MFYFQHVESIDATAFRMQKRQKSNLVNIILLWNDNLCESSFFNLAEHLWKEDPQLVCPIRWTGRLELSKSCLPTGCLDWKSQEGRFMQTQVSKVQGQSRISDCTLIICFPSDYKKASLLLIITWDLFSKWTLIVYFITETNLCNKWMKNHIWIWKRWGWGKVGGQLFDWENYYSCVPLRFELAIRYFLLNISFILNNFIVKTNLITSNKKNNFQTFSMLLM